MPKALSALEAEPSPISALLLTSMARQERKANWQNQSSVSTNSLRHRNGCREDQVDENNTSGINTEIKVNGQKLEPVTSFKYPGSLKTDEGSKPEILSRIAQTTAALTRLKSIWNDRSISLRSKIRMMRSCVISIFLYACFQRRTPATESRCYRKILRISKKDHVTNEEVHAKIRQAIGPHEDFLTIVKRRKLQWYEHVSLSSGLAKTILQGTVKGRKDKADRRRNGKTS